MLSKLGPHSCMENHEITISYALQKLLVSKPFSGAKNESTVRHSELLVDARGFVH